MRAIEEKMVKAIKKGRNFKLQNTQVIQEDNGSCSVYLWDNLIAKITDFHVELHNWCKLTKTTKDRMNAILSLTRAHIYQKNYNWFVDNTDDDKSIYEFPKNAVLIINRFQ